MLGSGSQLRCCEENVMRSDDEPETICVRTRFPIIVQLVLGGERNQEFTIRRALVWTTWSAGWWLLVAGLYAIATSASSPEWAVAIAFGLILFAIFIALVCSFFAVGYSCGLIIERWRLRKHGRAQS